MRRSVTPPDHRFLRIVWSDFCTGQLGITRRWADLLIDRLASLGPDFFKLNNFTRIRPADFQRIPAAVTEQGLSFGGQIIPFVEAHTADLGHAVEELRRESELEAPSSDAAPDAGDDAAQRAFARAEKSLQSAFAEFERLRSMNLDEDARLRLVLACETGRDHLERLRLSTEL